MSIYAYGDMHMHIAEGFETIWMESSFSVEIYKAPKQMQTSFSWPLQLLYKCSILNVHLLPSPLLQLCTSRSDGLLLQPVCILSRRFGPLWIGAASFTAKDPESTMDRTSSRWSSVLKTEWEPNRWHEKENIIRIEEEKQRHEGCWRRVDSPTESSIYRRMPRG